MSANGTVRLVLRNFAAPGQATIDGAMQRGAYEMFKRALKVKPEEVTTLVKASGLRGHGGAGFFAGAKWGFIPKDKFPRYVCVNGDESEPGTCKDRLILRIRPAPDARRRADLRLGRAGGMRLRLRPRRIFLSHGSVEKAIADAKAKGFWGENILRQRLVLPGPHGHRRGSIHLWRGNGAHRIAGREEGLAAP